MAYGGESGLNLKILNALDAPWQDAYFNAIQDWTKSGVVRFESNLVLNPDNDENCSNEVGFVKICNNDYGDSKWRGISRFLLADGFLISG